MINSPQIQATNIIISLLTKLFLVSYFSRKELVSVFMNDLKVYVVETGRSYRFRPEREYVIGSESDCSLLIVSEGVSRQHVKVYFDSSDNAWYVIDLGSTTGTFIENKRIQNCIVRVQTKIVLGSTTTLVLTPEKSEVVSTQQVLVPDPPSVQPPSGGTSRRLINEGSQSQMKRRKELSTLRRLSFKDYVDEQVGKQKNWFAKVITDFHLTTGLRNTPWIRMNSDSGNLDFGFDGYIMPDFLDKGSCEEVIRAITGNMSYLRQYQGTDCYITSLTDEHIINSAKETILQSLFSFRFFPVRRGLNNRYDYRDFMVVSYNNIRTYLLVEEYGKDLFVSWVTRYEPNFASSSMIWLITCIWLTLVSIFATSGNLILSTFPLVIWYMIYLLLPQIVKILSILPKRPNAYLLCWILFSSYVPFVIGSLLGNVGAGFVGTTLAVLTNGIYIAGISLSIWAIEKYTSSSTNFRESDT